MASPTQWTWVWVPRFDSWVRKIHWRKDRLPTPVFLGFPCGSAGKEAAYNVGDLGLIPGLGRSPGGRNGYPLQYSGLENSMECIYSSWGRKSQTRLSDFHFHCRIIQGEEEVNMSLLMVILTLITWLRFLHCKVIHCFLEQKILLATLE